MPVCLDASVLVASVLPYEQLSPAAEKLLVRCDRSREQLIGPACTLPEVTSAIRKNAFDGQISDDEAKLALERIVSLPVRYLSRKVQHSWALRTAAKLGHRSAYDHHYLWVAMTTRSDLWSGDNDFIRWAKGIYPRCHTLLEI